jgi:hypothetical protein
MAAAAEVLGEGVRFFASHGKSFSLPDRLGILGGSLCYFAFWSSILHM